MGDGVTKASSAGMGVSDAVVSLDHGVSVGSPLGHRPVLLGSTQEHRFRDR